MAHPRSRHPDVDTVATPVSTTTLKNGDLSVVLHIPSHLAAAAYVALHPLLQREVNLEIFDEGEWS